MIYECAIRLMKDVSMHLPRGMIGFENCIHVL